MPKNDNGNVTCINNQEHRVIIMPQIGVMHMQGSPDANPPITDGNFNFDVYICTDCEYTEFYAKKYDGNLTNKADAIAGENQG